MRGSVKGPDKLVIAKSRVPGGGYGIFAKDNIAKGELLETAPFIEVSKETVYQKKKNRLQDYVFTSHINPDQVIVVFGYGSMFNHSPQNNVYYRINRSNPQRFLDFVAGESIPRGAELLINYGPGHQVNKR